MPRKMFDSLLKNIINLQWSWNNLYQITNPPSRIYLFLMKSINLNLNPDNFKNLSQHHILTGPEELNKEKLLRTKPALKVEVNLKWFLLLEKIKSSPSGTTSTWTTLWQNQENMKMPQHWAVGKNLQRQRRPSNLLENQPRVEGRYSPQMHKLCQK